MSISQHRSGYPLALLAPIPVAIGMLATLPNPARASALRDMSLYEEAKSLSSNPLYQWSAALQRRDNNLTFHASAVLIAPDLYLTAGHYTPPANTPQSQITQIIFGP